MVIRRGALEASIDGASRVSLVCYHRNCRQLNVVHMLRAPPLL
jgi:hypothetical protein